MKNKIEKLLKYIEKSNNIAFFGGAGVSTESGIPDFRSKDGLYNQHDIKFDKYTPEYLLSKECLYNNPKVFYEFYRQKLDTRNVEPNITHYVLAKLEEMGKLKAVVTQNIDGLHQKAGSKTVHEIHGTTQSNYCVKCGKKFPADYIFNSKDSIPKCDECGRMVRPDVTMYGENLPKEAVNNALNSIAKADMLIIGGTSLTVYPAANYIYEFTGEHMVIINRDPLKNITLGPNDIVIQGSLGDVFREIDKCVELKDTKNREGQNNNDKY